MLDYRSRLWLLGGFHILATPFAALTLYLSPPWAFASLMGYYFFAETWFAILFTVILELVPENTRYKIITYYPLQRKLLPRTLPNR